MQFVKVNISQGSVAKPDRSGGNFVDNFVANCLPSLPVKEFCKLVKIWQRYRQELHAMFLTNGVDF